MKGEDWIKEKKREIRSAVSIHGDRGGSGAGLWSTALILLNQSSNQWLHHHVKHQPYKKPWPKWIFINSRYPSLNYFYDYIFSYVNFIIYPLCYSPFFSKLGGTTQGMAVLTRREVNDGVRATTLSSFQKFFSFFAVLVHFPSGREEGQ